MVMIMGKKAPKCAVTKMPSASGKCLAPKTLNAATPKTDAKISSVACHLVGT